VTTRTARLGLPGVGNARAALRLKVTAREARCMRGERVSALLAYPAGTALGSLPKRRSRAFGRCCAVHHRI
jgi:hypothetical protein